jgi:hypothetical protein
VTVFQAGRRRTLTGDSSIIVLEGVVLAVRVKVEPSVLVLDGDSVVVSELCDARKVMANQSATRK